MGNPGNALKRYNGVCLQSNKTQEERGDYSTWATTNINNLQNTRNKELRSLTVSHLTDVRLHCSLWKEVMLSGLPVHVGRFRMSVCMCVFVKESLFTRESMCVGRGVCLARPAFRSFRLHSCRGDIYRSVCNENPNLSGETRVGIWETWNCNLNVISFNLYFYFFLLLFFFYCRLLHSSVARHHVSYTSELYLTCYCSWFR